MSRPISTIVINAVIPQNNSNYIDTFQKIEIPHDYDLRVTSITASYDTSYSYNITETCTCKFVEFNSGNEQVYTISPGYYTKEDLTNLFDNHLLFDNQGHSYIRDTKWSRLDLTNCKQLQRILGLKKHYLDANTISELPCDLHNGLDVLHIYSSLIEQPYLSDSFPMITLFQTVETGLYQISTVNNLSLKLADFGGTLDRIHYTLKNKYYENVDTLGPIYLSITVSVLN